MSRVLTACMAWPFGRSCVAVQSGETLLAATIEDQVLTLPLQIEAGMLIKLKDLLGHQGQLFRKSWHVIGR